MGIKIHNKLFTMVLFSLVLLALVFIQSSISAFEASQVKLSVKKGSPSTITATVSGNPYNFTNTGVTNDNLITGQIQRAQGIYGLKYSFNKPAGSGATLCDTLPGFKSPYTYSGTGYDYSHSGLYVNWSDPSSSNNTLTATIRVFIYSGSSASNCQLVNSSGTFGFSQTASYSPSIPAGSQGSEFRDGSFKGAAFKFQDAYTILATIPGHTGTISFVDKDPVDTKPEYVSAGNIFCNNSIGKLEFNIRDRSSPNIALNKQLTLFYYNAQGQCKSTDLTKSGFKAVNTNNIASRFLTWGGDKGTQLASLGDTKHTFSAQQLTSGVSKTMFITSTTCGRDDGYGVVLSSDTAGTVYRFNGWGSSDTPFPACAIQGPADGYKVIISGTRGVATSPTNGTGNTESGADCQSQASGISGATLTYVMCPMIEGAQSATNALTSLIQTQLSFTVEKNIDKNPQGSNVKRAWSQIRDLSSILLVIIMLVMVLSQTVSWGPFDAYTVRKILPKLVVAVLAMQLSWSLLSYIVQLFDDLGKGVGDLLYGPFGGASAVNLQSVLNNAGINAWEAGTVSIVGLLAIGAIAALSLPTLLLIGWSIFMASVVVYITLAVRQILIIACLIFAPLALLAWILPGTQRYWKMWYDNFSKLLMMFPLIIGMIAMGQIFALITSSASTDKLSKFILIILGFYLPFYFVPKAFKWGGQAMSMAGGAIAGVAPKLGGPMTNYLKGRQERSYWHQAREARKAQLGAISKEKYGASLAGGSRRTRSMLLGGGKNREVLRRATASAQAEREKLLQQQAAERLAPLVEAGNWSGPGGIVDMARTGTSQEREAAISQMVKSRRWGELSQYRQAQGADTADWDRTFAKNGDLHEIMTNGRADIMAGPANPIGQVIAGGAGVAGMTPSQLVQQNHSFWTRAGAEIGTASDAEVQGTYDRMQLMARDPRALGMIGGQAEPGVSAVLAEHHRRTGTGATSLRSLVEQESSPTRSGTIPTVAPVPTQGVIITPAGTMARGPIPPTQQALHGMTDSEIGQLVANAPASGAHPAGSWEAFAHANPAEAMFLYNNRSDDIKARAAAALRATGHIS